MFLPYRSWTRRDFLRLAGRAGLLGACPTLASAAAALESDTVCISILHTTDLHGHILPTSDYDGTADRGGLARCVTQIRRWRRQNPNSILIDVGDVYQGTDVSLRNKGGLMIDLFNHLKYDAWVIGNHEFDWGIEPFTDALQGSAMPVLGANTTLDGKPAGSFFDSQNPFAKVQPFIIREIAGIKVAIIGITTPGMSFWLPREFTVGIDFQHPVDSVRRAIAKAKTEGTDAIVLAGHMGLKPRTGGDDFANTVMALTSEFPNVAAFIAGHTHQAIPSRLTNGVLFTQADHFGIHVGRVDLLFDRNSKKLLRREAICERMDSRFDPDQVVLSRAGSQLAKSEAALAQPIGELTETLHARGRHGHPSEIEKLIGAAITEVLAERSIIVDAVMHGVFDENAKLPAGLTTVSYIWNIIPYENLIVTATLSPDEIRSVMDEVYVSHEPRSLLGIAVRVEGRGVGRRITSMTFSDGRALERDKKYVIALNSFDARSGGHHFMRLRALLDRPEANCVLHPVQTRDAVIDYFRRHKVVHRIVAHVDGDIAYVMPKYRRWESQPDLTSSPLQKGLLSLAYLAMRLGIFCFVGLLLSGCLASAQTPKPGSPSPSAASKLPEVRPALIGTAPNSLINTIDTADLTKKGQKEAAVMFSCLVAPTGQVVTRGVYRGTLGSEPLEQELLKRLATARFIPAIHNHQPVIAIFYGTVKFAVVNGKPRLRIFANQQLEEVDKETDFIDPQPYVGQDSKFTGLHYPESGSTVAITGVVELALSVDAKGNLTNLQALSEEPPLLGFGDAALSDFSGAKFIPAFRNGQPVESNVKIPVYYKPSA